MKIQINFLDRLNLIRRSGEFKKCHYLLEMNDHFCPEAGNTCLSDSSGAEWGCVKNHNQIKYLLLALATPVWHESCVQSQGDQ